MRKFGLAALAAIVVLVAVLVFWPKAADRGNPRFFADQTYNFETIRALNDVAVAGGDSEETNQAIAGLKAGDLMVAFDGAEIRNLYDFTYALRTHKAGDEVAVQVLRGAEKISVRVKLTERK